MTSACERSPSTKMRVGIVSDTHSRYETVARALAILEAQGAETVLHCGDIEDAQTVQMFASIPTHFVFGNCDDQGPALRQAMKAIGAQLHEPFGCLALGRFQLAWLH